MKNLFAAAAIAVLAACSPSEEAAEPAETETMPEATAEPLALDGQASVGMYRVTSPDGTAYTQEVRADGTYTNTPDEGETAGGTWRQESPEVFCTTKDEEGAVEECSDEAMDAEGKWMSTDRETGEVSTVERLPS